MDSARGPGIVRGVVYTIREVLISPVDRMPLVRLREIFRNLHPLGHECGFTPDRFRPAVEDKSDNEIEAQIYRKKVHQNAAPPKVSERA